MTKKECCIIDFKSLEYAKLIFDVVNETDKENWDYFSSDTTELARDFLQYGVLSRVIVERDVMTGKETAAGYVHVRLLKDIAPTLLYNDFYHQVGLSGSDLWETDLSKTGCRSLYVDVIAVKQQYQNRLNVLKLIPQALEDIINGLESFTGEIYAVAVSDYGRKMCQMLGMGKKSEVLRYETENSHTRTLFVSDSLLFKENLKRVTRKRNN